MSRAQAKNAYRGVLGFHCKQLLQEVWLQEHVSGLLSSGEGVLYRASAAHGHRKPTTGAAHRQKILPRRNRILGKWLFRRLAVDNTIKALGFRNVL